jgi:carboxymethylenebutenolidase
VASKDQFVPPEAQQEIAAGLSGNSNVTLHVYEGRDHAFARVGGDHYDEAAAELANGRSIEHLKRSLSR